MAIKDPLTLDEFKDITGWEGQVQLGPIQKSHDFQEQFGDITDPTYDTMAADTISNATMWYPKAVADANTERAFQEQKLATEAGWNSIPDQGNTEGFLDNWLYPVKGLMGSFRSSLGGDLVAAGTWMKGHPEWFQKGGLGDLLLNTGDGERLTPDDIIAMGKPLEAQGQLIQNAYGLGKEFQNMGLLDRLTNADYMNPLNPQGWRSSMASGVGSSMPALLMSAGAPEIGIGTKVLGGLSKLGSRYVPELVTALKNKNFAVWAKNTVENAINSGLSFGVANAYVEAAADASENIDEFYKMADRQGLTGEARDKYVSDMLGTQILKEVPGLIVTDTLTGAMAKGKLFGKFKGSNNLLKRGGVNVLGTLADAAGEYLTEASQTRIGNEMVGKSAGTWYNPTDEEAAAGAEGFFGGFGMTAPGAVYNTVFGGKNTNANDPLLSKRNMQAMEDVNKAIRMANEMGHVINLPTSGGNLPSGGGNSSTASAPIGIDAVEAGVAPFLGVRMDNGENGCVEAVTKIGAQMGSPFLSEQLNKGVVYVPTLVKNAGDRVIPFDANQLEAGDLIIYGDDDHVVMYDGKGGYVGNSSSQQKVVHGSDYTSMDDLQPTKIIKSDSIGGGVGAGNINAADAVGQLDDMAAASLMDDFISNAVVNGQMSQESLAMLLDDKGHFVNNAENRAALLDNNEDLFRQYLSDIVSNSDNETKRNNAKLLLDTMKASQRQSDTIKKANSGIVNEIINNAGSKNKNIKGFYNDFIQDRISSIDDANEINELSSMLNVKGKFQNTPENRQALAQKYKNEIADYYNNVYGPRHKASAQQEPVQQAPTQPVQQPQQAQVPTVQNNAPMAQQAQEQQQEQVNYQAMGNRMLDMMKQRSIPHNAENLALALNSGNNRLQALALRHMYNELANNGMDTNELNNELTKANTPLLEEGGISNAKNQSENSYAETTTATEGINSTDQVQDTEPEQAEKTGEVIQNWRDKVINAMTPLKNKLMDGQISLDEYEKESVTVINRLVNALPENMDEQLKTVIVDDIFSTAHILDEEAMSKTKIPHKYQDVQKVIDEYEDQLVDKYNDVSVLFDNSKLTTDEIRHQSILIAIRDKIGKQDDEVVVNEILSRLKTYEVVNREEVEKMLHDMIKEHTIENVLGDGGKSLSIQELTRKVYNVLSHKTDYPHWFHGDFDLALEVANAWPNTDFGVNPAPLLQQSYNIANAIMGNEEKTGEPENVTGENVLKVLPQKKENAPKEKQNQQEAQEKAQEESAQNEDEKPELFGDNVVNQDAVSKLSDDEKKVVNDIFEGRGYKYNIKPNTPTANETETDTNDGGKTEPKESHFETGTFTHTKTGKQIPMAKAKDRVERDVYNKIANVAKQYAGKWSKFAKAFLFQTEKGRDAFVEAAEKEVFGQEPQKAPANEAKKERNYLIPDEYIGSVAEYLYAFIEDKELVSPRTLNSLEGDVFVSDDINDTKNAINKMSSILDKAGYDSIKLIKAEVKRSEEKATSKAPKETPKQETPVQKPVDKKQEKTEAQPTKENSETSKQETKQEAEPENKTEFQNMDDDYYGFFSGTPKYKSLGIAKRAKEHLEKYRGQVDTPTGGFADNYKDMVEKAAKSRYKAELDNDDSILKYTRPWSQKSKYYIGSMEVSKTVYDYYNYLLDNHMVENEVDDGHYGFINKQAHNRLHTHGDIAEDLRSRKPDGSTAKERVESLAESYIRDLASGKKESVDKFLSNKNLQNIEKPYFEYLINNEDFKSKVEAESKEEKPADSKRDFIRDHVIVGTVPTEKASEKKTEKESVFGDKAENDAAMLEALGINPDELSDDKILTAPEGIVNTAEERARLEKELMAELNKLSANPVFNPKIYSLGLQIGMTYVKDGINTAKKLVTKLKATFGDKIGPWAPAIAETISTWPKGVPFNEKAVMAISKAVGSRFEEGLTSLDEIQDSMKEVFKNRHKEFAPMIEASYNGIKKYFDMKEAENNEQRGESESTDAGHEGLESRGSKENELEGTGGVSGQHGREGERHGSDNGQEDSNGSAASGVRAGTELETPASNGTDKRGNKSTVQMTEAQKHPSPTETPGHDYVIKDNAVDVNKKSEAVRFKQNIDAIKMLKQLETDDRMPTPSEQEVLAGYNGWGGLKGAFVPVNDKNREMNKELHEVLTDEEYEAAKSTINDAFYTSPKIIRAMWEGISRMGFKGGRILEPSMGIGNFFGAMPKDVRKKSSLHGIELDDLTSRFAKMLYPNAQIEHTGFQNAKAPDNFFDLVVSNIPFGQLTIDGYMIHNYFFANGMDKVRPGGLMMYITSQGSLAGSTDAAKMRTYLDGKADMIGAFKLPAGAFGEAGTSVATDIVIFRKRDKNGEKSPHAQNFLNVKTQFSDYGSRLYDMNEYFVKHPENMIGTISPYGRDRFGKPALRLEMEGDIDDVAKALSEAMKTLPKNIYKPVSRNDSKVYNQKDADKKAAADENIRDFAYYLKGSEVYQNQNGEEVQITGKKNVEILTDFIQLKHTLNALLTAERDPKATDDKIENVRKLLNKEYDSFVKKHGYLNDSKAARYFKDDPFAGFVQVLEKPIEETFTRTNKNGVVSTHKRILGVNKSDIFTKRTMQPKSEVTHVEKSDDALIASLTNKGYVDIDYMAGLMKTTPEKIIGDLKGKIFKNPASSDYETREEYFSGNVKEKLAQAEAAAKEDYTYADNVEELKKVVPEDLVSSEIDVMMGAPWIPEADVQKYVDSVSTGHLNVSFNRLAGTWYVNGYGSSAKYKLDGIKLPTFIEKVLNNMPIKIFDGTGDKKTLNQQKTDAANLAAEEMRRDFKDWLWTDKERENRLVKYYNDNFNTDVVRDYDGSHLTFPGMNGKIKMKPHQKNVVWRMLQGLNTLIAHCVGAGKTFEMQAAGMEMRRLGIANKPMYCLPNNVLEQFAREFRQLYPQAKILTLQSTDLPAVQKTVKMEKTEDGRRKKVDLLKGKTKAERDKILASRADRTRMLSRIRSEDWDAILISHTLFERFPLSPETTAQFIRDEINLLERTITEAKGAGNMSNTDLSNLVNAKKKLEDELEEALSASVDDIGISFEDLGIDQLFVDEADMFKNLGFHTKLGNIRGLNAKSKSNRARDMFAKTQWLTRTMGGRGVVFATGTPISNTMAEMYIMLRYLDSADLNKLGLDVFDNWIRTFGDIGQDVERKPTGDGFREVTKVKRFVNMTELKKLFRKVADIKTQDELDLDIPKLKNDKPTVVTLEPDPAIVNYIKNVVPKRVAAMGKGFKKQKGEDNMLALTNDLRKLSLNEDKIEACADRIAKKYFDTTDIKGAQLVFCDMGIPKAMSDKDKTEEEEDKETFDVENPEVYKRLIEKLIDKGIPEKEIAFIQNYNTKKKRDAIFQRVYNGDVRVLVGSTETMGAGTNCQKHLVALHDLDAPWRPRDLEQRHGRILRQGNENDEVEIFNYVVKDSFDANMWEKLKNKAAVIAQAVNNDMSIRTLEDVELNTISYAEIEEAATGNPLIKERLNVNNALIKEKNANTAFKKKVYDAENVLDGHEKKIEEQEATIKKVEEDIANRQDTKGDNFSMTLNKKNFDKRNDAEKELNKVMADFKSRKAETIGNIGGFRLNAAFDGSKVVLQLVGKRAYNVQTNSITGIENALRTAPDNALKLRKTLLREFKDQVEQAKEIVQLKNPHEAKVKELDDRLHEIDRQIKESLTDKGEKQQPKNDVVTDLETGEIIESKPSFSVSVKKEDSQIEAVRKQYEGNDQWLKAPNGKPTNLTEQQWLQVRTPNFKKWFGDWENDPETASKVVDENGEPLVVYHGTEGTINNNTFFTDGFKNTKETGAWFTTNRNIASSYGNNVQEVFLNIRNPYEADLNGGYPNEITKAIVRNMDTNEVIREEFDNGDGTVIKKLDDYISNELNDPQNDVYEVATEEYDTNSLVRAAKKDNKIDGVALKNLTDINADSENVDYDNLPFGDDYVVFNPNQIKSATENSGAFSTDNDNINTSVSKTQKPADPRTVEELKADILEAVPNAKNVVDTGNGITMTLPNGAKMKVEISKSLDDKVSENDKHAARLAHGLGNEVSITVNGYTLTGAKQAFIELALNGEKGTAFHEIFHVAYEMALTDAEKRAINIAFGEQAKASGMSVIEYAADKYRDWRTYARKLPVGLRKAFEAIKGTIDSMRRALLGINDEYLTDEVERIFRDIESGAIWERNAKKNSENSLDNFLQNFDNEEKRYYQSKKYERKDMQRAFDEVRKGIEAVKDKIIAAKNHQKLDEIRADIDYIKNAILAFNQTSNLDDYYKDNFACDVRFALEVFENEGIVKAARNRIDKETSPEYQRGRNFRNLPAVRDGLQPTNGHRVRRNEFANSGFRLTDNINHIGANKHFIESFEKFIEAHPENYNKKLYSANEKHSDQGAFSNGENAPQSFLEKAFKSFAKNSNIKGDKIIVEQQDKDGEKEEVNLKNYIFSSPSRIAEKVGAFKYFYTIGKRAMDVLTQKRTDFERKLNKAFDLIKNEEDYKTLNDLLISGDVQGKEWTKAELIADGVKENVAEAYTQIRHLMEKAYKMVNEARRRPQIHTINNATKKQIQDLRDNDFVDILNIKEDDKGHKKVTYKEYANWERTYTVNKKALRKYDDDPAIQVLDIKQDGDDSFTVTVRESIPPVNKLTGYIPHFFHNYMVRIVDKDGGYVDTIDSGRTEREAVQKAEEWLKSNQLEDGQTIHISPKIADFTSLGMDEKQYAAVMGDKDYYRMMNNIAKQNDLTFQEAKEMLNGSVRQKNRHRFFGNLMQRKGVNGYEKNMGYILRHYFNSASRYYAMETEFKPKAINMYERLYGDFDKEAPNTTADYTRDYINDINGNPTTLEKAINNALNKSSIFRKFVASNFGDRAALQMANNITSATSYLCLGYLNASSALLNLTQLINTAAYLNDFEALGKGLAKGFHHKYNLKDLRVLHESNVLNDIGLDSGSGYDVNRMGAKNLLGKLNKGGMLLFKKTEAYCRCATVLAAYESAIKKGKSHNEAIEYAKEINRKSNFDYGVADAPNVFRRGSILSQLLLQFKKYGIKELEVMGDMLPWNEATNGKQKAIFWGLMLLACGLLQWPGEDFLDNVFFDGKLKPKMKAWMMEAAGNSPMGKALAKAAMYGLAAPITGVDISNRAGLADVIPSKGRDIGGPSITRTVSLAADLFQGKWADALRDVSPGLYNQYAAWFAGQSTGTRGRVNNYYDTLWEKGLRAMGFKSVDESIDSDIQRITSIRKKEATEEKQRAIDNYIEDPSTENYRRLVELGVKAKTVQEERKKKKMDRLERIQSGMSKNDKKGNSGLIQFAE